MEEHRRDDNTTRFCLHFETRSNAQKKTILRPHRTGINWNQYIDENISRMLSTENKILREVSGENPFVTSVLSLAKVLHKNPHSLSKDLLENEQAKISGQDDGKVSSDLPKTVQQNTNEREKKNSTVCSTFIYRKKTHSMNTKQYVTRQKKKM